MSLDGEQIGSEIGRVVQAFLTENSTAMVWRDGHLLFDLSEAKWAVTDRGDRCTLQVWSDKGNVVRTLTSFTQRKHVLRLGTTRLGSKVSENLELVAGDGRRVPSMREGVRHGYLRVLQRVMVREFGGWRPHGFRSAMDLERSFGPAYARGTLRRGKQAWCVVGTGEAEAQSTVDGILTIGLLWLAHCREGAEGGCGYLGLKLIVPSGTAATTLSRLAWIDRRVGVVELFELDQQTERFLGRDPADHGNLATRLVRAPDERATWERFGQAIPRVLSLLPAAVSSGDREGCAPSGECHRIAGVREESGKEHRSDAAGRIEPLGEVHACAGFEMRVRSNFELAFLFHGLEFARIRSGFGRETFNRELQVTVGSGPNETPLTSATEPRLRELVHTLFERRQAGREGGAGSGSGAGPGAGARDPLFRMQTERWLESSVRRKLSALDAHLRDEPVYSQVPALTGAGNSLDRGMLDLLGVRVDSRLAVIELKAEEDLHLALQGLDYWIRVRHHHLANVDSSTGLGDLQQHGYFPETRLSSGPPHLYLVAPALHIHPATESILRCFDARVDWTLIALDERWRTRIKPVWKRRSTDLEGRADLVRG